MGVRFNMKKRDKNLLELIGGCVFTLTSVYTMNRLTFFLATIKEHLFNSNGTYYNHPSGRIYYTKEGTGTPILLIHDLNSTSSGYEWCEIVNTLSKDHTVYTIDLLGCGRSDKPNITYTTYLYVQQISSFVQDIIVDAPECIVTGESASLVTMTTSMYPNLFKKITFINPTHFASVKRYPGRYDKMIKTIIELPIIGTFLYNVSTSRSNIFKNFKKKYFASKNTSAVKYISRYHEAAHLKGYSCKYLYASQKCHYLGCDITTAFSNIEIPVNVILGEALDSITATRDYLRSLNPTAQIYTFPNAAYLPHLERPAAFLRLLEKTDESL